jgi:hypothetical protein
VNEQPTFAQLASGQFVDEPTPREQAIRERFDWSRYTGQGDITLFGAHEVGYLLAIIDGLRQPRSAH